MRNFLNELLEDQLKVLGQINRYFSEKKLLTSVGFGLYLLIVMLLSSKYLAISLEKSEWILLVVPVFGSLVVYGTLAINHKKQKTTTK